MSKTDISQSETDISQSETEACRCTGGRGFAWRERAVGSGTTRRRRNHTRTLAPEKPPGVFSGMVEIIDFSGKCQESIDFPGIFREMGQIHAFASGSTHMGQLRNWLVYIWIVVH